MTIAPEQIAVAVRWWGDRLRAWHVDDELLPETQSSPLAIRNLAPLTEEQIVAFEEALARRIDNEARTYLCSCVRIGTEYAPCEILLAAAEEAGFGVRWRFPVQTKMFITANYIRMRQVKESILYKDGSSDGAHAT